MFWLKDGLKKVLSLNLKCDYLCMIQSSTENRKIFSKFLPNHHDERRIFSPSDFRRHGILKETSSSSGQELHHETVMFSCACMKSVRMGITPKYFTFLWCVLMRADVKLHHQLTFSKRILPACYKLNLWVSGCYFGA